jgi:hypothetical protein
LNDMSRSSVRGVREWKPPAATTSQRRATLDLSTNALEPQPPFIRRLTAALADAGAVRRRLLWLGDRPSAAQIAPLAGRGAAGARRHGSAGAFSRRAGGRAARRRAPRHGHEV